LNVPSVVSIRGNDIERAAFDPGKFSHVMYALQNASAVTTNANVLVNKAKAFFDREIFLIPNGVDTEHFKPMEKNRALTEALYSGSRVTLSEAKGLVTGKGDSSVADASSAATPPLSARLPQSDTVPVIGFVGELREKKGLKTLLSAYAQIYKKLHASLLIVGEIRQGEDKQLFDEFRISNPELRIIVTGYIPPADLPANYSLMDVFVHSSLRDGMPNAVLEAMACERAVIATPVGGVPDILEDGKNGILVPVNDPERLAEKILGLLADPSLRSRLGKNARETITEGFTPEMELAANLDVYRKIGLHP
jgi:glycosyltransferase involved in cell wall biosynthesis